VREISTPRLLTGVVLWAVVLYVSGSALLSEDGVARGPAEKVLRFAGESPRELEVAFPLAAKIAPGDPVLLPHPEEFLIQVGHVVDVRREDEAVIAILRLDPTFEAAYREGLGAEEYTVPSSAAWVVGTLLPPERLSDIRTMAKAFFDEHGTGLRDALWPEVREGILEVLGHVERELPAALAAQSDQWNEFFSRHRDGVLREKLMPVLEEVTLKIAKERFDPLIGQVGSELWDALPAWSIGWRYVWEKVPLTPADQAKARFEQFVEDDATPILASHADDAARIAGEVIRESLKDSRVRAALKVSAKTMASDPELGAMAKDILNGVFLENHDLREVVRQRWERGLGDAVQDAVSSLEPLIKKAVDSVVLDEETGRISPRLSRVVRCRVLMKDGRWVLLSAGDGTPLADGARISGTLRDE